MCPWRDCEGLKFYQSGASLDVNCQVTDGWNQLGPLHPEGTRYDTCGTISMVLTNGV